jgi:type II secretory pathway pseudopilin PulG
VTLIEMSLVILVLLALMSAGFMTSNAYKSWTAGKQASDTLRTVYVAQRTFFADNPTVPINTVTHALLLPYLPNNPTSFPTVKSLTGGNLTIFVGASPPYLTTSSTSSGSSLPARYDPSNDTNDSLWDVGE